MAASTDLLDDEEEVSSSFLAAKPAKPAKPKSRTLPGRDFCLDSSITKGEIDFWRFVGLLFIIDFWMEDGVIVW